MISHIFETYKNAVRQNDRHMHKIESYIVMGKCVLFSMYIMRCLIGNFCYVVVPNLGVLSYLVNNQAIMQQTHIQKYVLMST